MLHPIISSSLYLYGNKPHAVRQAGNLSFQYDANGNMTQRYDGGTSVTLDLTWNHDNKPSVISRRVGGGQSQPYLTFTYDGNNQRVRKYNHFTGATSLYFGEVYEVRNEEPIIHLFANTQRVASIHEDGRMQYYHGNHLNSASVVTDGYGNTKETIEYHPYGTYRLRTDLDAAFPNVNYTFTDQEEDDEAGLYNYKARLYDPLLGRFISADSIVPEPGNLQAFNRYSYCLNNPVVYIDPSGQSWVSDWLDDVGLGFINDLWEPAVVMVAGAVGMTVCGPSCAMAAAGATDYAITGSIESAVASAAQTGLFIAAGDFSSGDADWIKVSAHVGAGAASGAIRAGLTGGNLGRAAFTGGVSAGFAEYAGLKLFGEDKLLPDKYKYRLPVHAAVGGIIGGFANELFGGSFKEGFYQGLRSGAFGATFNWLFHGPMFLGRWTVYPRWLSRWIYKVQDIAPREAAEWSEFNPANKGPLPNDWMGPLDVVPRPGPNPPVWPKPDHFEIHYDDDTFT